MGAIAALKHAPAIYLSEGRTPRSETSRVALARGKLLFTSHWLQRALIMSGTPTVIIVDDDRFVRDSLAQLVASMDLAAECFESAEQFLDGADLSRPGCIVLDICLPGLSGLSLHKVLSESGFHPPVIIVSGHADIPTAVRAMKLGVFDFLEKPYFPKQLVEIIRAAIPLDAKQREEASELECSKERLAKLTPEERAVLDGIGAGNLS